jgi:hypothetical protein
MEPQKENAIRKINAASSSQHIIIVVVTIIIIIVIFVLLLLLLLLLLIVQGELCNTRIGHIYIYSVLYVIYSFDYSEMTVLRQIFYMCSCLPSILIFKEDNFKYIFSTCRANRYPHYRLSYLFSTAWDGLSKCSLSVFMIRH